MRPNCTPTPVIAAAVLVALGAGVRAQFASGVTLVEVYATVTDARGNPVGDLRKEDFQVLEDGVPPPISTFASGDVPLAVAIAIDRSTSMAGEPLALANGRRAAILLSDGVDRYSRATAADVLDRADVLVYPVAIRKTRPPLFPRACRADRRPVVSAARSKTD